tara:strand:- start:1041 stop:1310 length:270 start_codon:yes stop_codon:yes gene_type:complete
MGIVDRTPPTVRGNLGKYNKIIKVNSSTTFEATGSNEAKAFILENVSNVVVHGSGGGQIPGTALSADTLYEIGVKKIVIGSSGIAYLLV